MKRARGSKAILPVSRLRARRGLAPLLSVVAFAYLLFVSVKLAGLGNTGPAPTVSCLPTAGASEPLRRRLEDPPGRVRAISSPSGMLGLGRTADEILQQQEAAEATQKQWGRTFTEAVAEAPKWSGRLGNFTELERVAAEAWALGAAAWQEASVFASDDDSTVSRGVAWDVEGAAKCPSSLVFGDKETRAFLPCGLAPGSVVTVVGSVRGVNPQYVEALKRFSAGNGTVPPGSFAVELHGRRTADGEEPPKILHLHVRLHGDRSGHSTLEMNTFRRKWGTAQRCDGTPSRDDDLVDGFKKCEKWERQDIVDVKETKTNSWFKRFIGRAKKPEMIWSFPISEGRMFVLTIQAGTEGYHINVGGRHVASFPHGRGFALEDAMGLAITGSIFVRSIYATALPKAHPSFSLQQVMEMSERWKAPPVPEEPIHLFIGILSTTNHFLERMAIRKTWMQFSAIRLGNAVARFFVALSQRKEINVALKKEAEYFGDIVILPFIDQYDLVILKTIALCQYGVQNVSADYIMKCDDDTFVRLDMVKYVTSTYDSSLPLYMGNMNVFHGPQRRGKWAVTYEEWPEAAYPLYANGFGYVISADIARNIASRHTNQSLPLFKMEDVSMGIWVKDYNASIPVQYIHMWRFSQFGCVKDFFMAHYQSPWHMMCLWEKQSAGYLHCCNLEITL